MTTPALFADDAVPARQAAAAEAAETTATPRLRPIERCQVEMRCSSLDQLLPPEHTARIVWAYVERVDITPLLQEIKAVAGQTGRNANDPRLLLALWLYATIEGVGSARELGRLCEVHLAYQWLCGGVSLNYHSLADFRKDHVAFLDQLLTDGVGTMLHQGLIDLQQVAQDGMRVRANAGASSFRREASLQTCLQEAQAQVEALRNQLDEDGQAATRRQQAARQRAARERVERVQQALAERQTLLELREKQKKEKGVKFEAEQLRASTTDPEARRMKMPDGGTRPGYNVQLATTAAGGVIVGVDVTNVGSDSGQMAPMLEQMEKRYDEQPGQMLVDGGFTNLDDIEAAHAANVTVYAPLKDEDKQKTKGIDPYQPKKGDGPGVAEWRQRMGTEAARLLYRLRSATAEWSNAQVRNRGLYQVRVRGTPNVLAVVLLHVLAHNMLRAHALQQTNQARTDS
jgi:transposase